MFVLKWKFLFYICFTHMREKSKIINFHLIYFVVNFCERKKKWLTTSTSTKWELLLILARLSQIFMFLKQNTWEHLCKLPKVTVAFFFSILLLTGSFFFLRLIRFVLDLQFVSFQFIHCDYVWDFSTNVINNSYDSIKNA